jgi:TRAP-type uncharacterized transport system fused permease subunit
MLTLTSAAAAIIMGVITSTGLMLKITSITLTLAQGSLLLGIVLVGLISLIVGLGLPVTMSYILVSTLAAPALGELGATLLTAHLVIFWFAQDSTITPPVCNTAFVAASIAGAPPMRTGWESLRVAKGLYLIPILLVYSNLLSGNLPLMLYDALAGGLGLALVPAVASGYLRGPLNPAARVLLAFAAAAFFGASFLNSMGASAPWMIGALLLGGGIYLSQRRQEPALTVPLGGVSAVSAPAANKENS